MLGCRDGVPLRAVHHDDAAGGCYTQVDIVHTDAGATDHAKLICHLEQVGRHLGSAAHDETVVPGDDPEQLIGVDPGLVIDLDALLGFEHGESLVGKLVRNQHAEHVLTLLAVEFAQNLGRRARALSELRGESEVGERHFHCRDRREDVEAVEISHVANA